MSEDRARGFTVPPFGPLAGVRVVDSGRLVAGPWAGTYLGEFGAEVIHVESAPFAPPYADASRSLVPRIPEGVAPESTVSESWVQYSRNKLSVGLDLRQSEGRSLFLKLLARSDIWVESSRPGTYDRLGLGDAEVHGHAPKLTIVHVSGYGQTGDPERIAQPSFDLTAQAYSGFLSLQGNPDPDPPMRAGTALNDTVTGLAAAAGALMGYIHAQRTGKGQTVDVAQYEVFFTLLENLALDYFARGAVRGRHGTSHARLFPYETVRALDGWVVVAAPTEESWRKLSEMMGLRHPSWTTDAGRRQDREEIVGSIRAYCAARSVAELEAEGRQRDAAVSGVFDISRIAKDPHFRARQMFVEWDDPVAGRVKGAGVAPKFVDTPGGVWRGAPWLGQDNSAVLTGLLGCSPEQLKDLESRGIVGHRAPEPTSPGVLPFFVREGL
jgi:crotonobetainyl-CoA:carnitine CoA-transferase CaiB-like acyl-CoA transferase